MAATSAIEWTDATWNPWMGCERVSPGCAHCYMYREQRQYGHDPEALRRSKTKFFEPLRWREPTLVFTCSWSDWFHPGADPWRDEAWEVVRQTPHLTYQILTKRPELIRERLPDGWAEGWPNVWLGVSIENSRFTWRADVLRDVPAEVRFISAEPLLDSLFQSAGRRSPLKLDGIDWLIVGGESGPGARALDVSWALELAAACDEGSIAFFMKQLGSVLGTARGMRDRKGGDFDAFPSQLKRREMPPAAFSPSPVALAR
ncbi:MAG: phage Gp37/Gp68 family protein [Actinomycetota bacterium]|nr:phage Gp37/Gp68 family protein [Actinomycetota bacterium]